MPQRHLSYPQTFPHGLVNSEELEVSRFSVSGTAFAFELKTITFRQGKMAIGNQDIRYQWHDKRDAARL
jgi:hypothetical protein